MSDKAVHYEIKITSVHVPRSLRGVRLPFEIIPQEGEAKRSLITLQEKHTETESVKWPGSYLVRTVLPSGQLIAKTTIVPQPTGPKGEASSEVTLDFGEYITVAEANEPSILETSNKYLPSRRGAVKKPSRIRRMIWFMKRGVSADPRVSCDYGMFVRWSPEASDESLETSSDALVIKPIGEASTSLPGNIEMERHPGWTPNSREWRPLLMRSRFSLPMFGTERQEALLICPPSHHPPPLTLLPDPDPGVNSNAPSLLAYSHSDDGEVDLLFSYVRGGALDLARQLAPRMIERAQEILQSKVSNPVNATLAAYALLKVSNTERQDWVRNLADWFEHLSDGAIIYGWYLIRAGKAEHAHKYFRIALTRGVPMYSEGVRLLRDGLNFLRGLYTENAQVQADATRANRMAASANLDSELTCLRLGKGLAVEFNEKAK